MTVSGLRDAIKTALETISGLKVYDTAPESVNEVPAAYILPRTGDYGVALGGITSHRFEIILLIAKGPGLSRAQDSLDAYLDPSGASSVKAAVEAAALSSHGSVIRCTGYRDYGALQYGENDNVYLGCKLDIEVIT